MWGIVPIHSLTVASSFKRVAVVFAKISTDMLSSETCGWWAWISSFKGKEHLHVRHTWVHWRMLFWGCYLASSHLFLILSLYSRVCATGKTATEMCVSFSPGSSFKRQQAPSAPLHYYPWLDPTCLRTCFPFPHQTIQFPALYTDTSLQFCRTRPGLDFALWSYMILWT